MNFLLRLIPENYKWQVATKKAAAAVVKLATSALMYGKVGQYLGQHLTPEQLQMVQSAVAGLTMAAMEGLHDWLKMHYPDSPLL